MWINEEVDIPEALITAQSENKLVVFAGAGVSMGPPSNLPGFERLAEQLAGGTLDHPDAEPFDRFLGRVEERGVDVQARTKNIIDDPESEPNPLHHHLVELFDSPTQLRIVTTNFDTHLTAAAQIRYSQNVDTYYAPALPLGREFSGIVYLHGSLTRPQRLVLTDTDFGRAYLTDGWATRFLMEMFATFTVLFIGYSHEDPVMGYLARGFVGRTARYAFTLSGNDEHWMHLGITPVHYPRRPAPAKHGALTESIRAWVEQAKRGALDHERRIGQIVQSPPLLEPHIEDYMESVIQETVTLRFFVKHAKTPEWLHWAEEKGVFDKLFTKGNITNERPKHIASWFASTFAVEYAQEALALIRKHGGWFNPVLWNAIAWQLARQDPRPSADVLAPWALVLTSVMGPGCNAMALGLLLAGCGTPQEGDVALLLFSRLARPEIKLKRTWFGLGDDARKPRFGVDVTLPGGQYDLRTAWAEYFQPQMDKLHCALRPMLTAFLTDIHHSMRASGQGSAWVDVLSYFRSAIEPHEQDTHRQPDDWEFLIDAARDLLEWLLANEPEEASALLEEWSRAEPPLLRRLAIYGMAESRQVSPDAALKKIERRDWLYDLPLKHEVYRLIEQNFPAASESAQQQFIDYSMSASVQRAEKDGAESPEPQEISEYERYNVAVWLNEVAPESLVARQHLEQLQAAHPEFGPRDNPDLVHWMSDVYTREPKSPESVENLVASAPEERLDWFLSFDPEKTKPGAYNREGLLNAIQQAVSNSFTWSWKLASALAQYSEWETDIWLSILEGWKDDNLTNEQRRQILKFLDQYSALDATFGRTIVGLLENWVDKDRSFEPTILNRVEHLADRLMDSSELSKTVVIESPRSWLAKAINHIGGHTTMLWLKTLSRRRANMGEEWSGLPEDYKTRFEEVVYGDGLNAQLARIVLASQAHFLFNLDPGWTERHLIPLFDWKRSALQAEQSWHGFLIWGQWNDALFSELLPYVRQTFSRLTEELSDVRDSLCKRLAAVAAYSLLDPWHDGWLMDFVREVDRESRTIWASSFGRHLKSQSTEAATRLWQQWISDYWSERLTGVPQSLSDGEKEEMIQWSIGLQSEFDAVVDKICASPAPAKIDRQVFYQLKESEIAPSHAGSMAHLLRHLLSGVESIPYSCDSIYQLARAGLDGGAARDVLFEVADSMGRLGCISAQELRERIEESD